MPMQCQQQGKEAEESGVCRERGGSFVLLGGLMRDRLVSGWLRPHILGKKIRLPILYAWNPLESFEKRLTKSKVI